MMPLATALKIKRLSPDAKLPTRATDNAAGLDLYGLIDCALPPNTRAVIPTGLAMEVPYGMAGFIWPRSGWAVKHGLDRLAGLIDADYRGEVGVVLHNDGTEFVFINRGERIAQMVIQRYEHLDPVWVEELDATVRGEGGFGHTGVV
jgi:dUTP pyrophosphatase